VRFHSLACFWFFSQALAPEAELIQNRKAASKNTKQDTL